MRLVLLLLLPMHMLAQDSAITFTEVVEIPGQSKDQLFIKGRQWLNEVIKATKAALQIEDKETGELTGKCKIESYYTEKRGKKDYKIPVIYDVHFSIFLKDGKYKYEFSNFECNEENSFAEAFGVLTTVEQTAYTNPFMRQSRIQAIYQSCKACLPVTMSQIISSLRSAMTKQSKSDF